MALQQRQPHPEGTTEELPPNKLTTQEVMVLKDCMREGFYKASLPLAAVLATGTYTACQTGYISMSPRWGSAGKVTGALIFGYFIGKILYFRTCTERLLTVPGGTYAAFVKKTQGNRESLDAELFVSLKSLDPPKPESQPLEHDSSSLNLDLDTVKVSEPEFMRPYSDDFSDGGINKLTDSSLSYNPPITTYEELRERNRAQYESLSSPLLQGPSTRQYRPPSSSVLLEPEERITRKKKNKYGDDVDE